LEIRLSQDPDGRKESDMRKTASVLGGAVSVLLATAMPALADSSLPQPQAGPQVLGSGGTGGGGAGGTAFTGADLSLALVALAILMVCGVLLLALRRGRIVEH
jgi:hypothetical protein